jgi:hypothetical protein
MSPSSPATVCSENPEAELARLRAENDALRAQVTKQAAWILQLLERT